MAKTRTTQDDGRALATLPELEDTQAPPQEPEQAPPPSDTRAETKKAEREIGKKHLTFWERVDSVDRDDWGTRVKATLYRLEPLIDRTRTQEHRYVSQYTAWFDQEKVKQEHGSGRYQVYLNFKEPGKRQGPPVDMIEFDIFDLKFPPNLPIGEWMEDPRNNKWGWAKEILEKRAAEAETKAATTAAPQQAGMSAKEVLGMVREITADLRDQMQPTVPQKSAAGDLESLVKAARDIADLKTPPPAPVTTNSAELTALREDMKYYRERTDKLTDDLIKAVNSKPQGESGLKGLKEIIDTIKTILPDARDLLSPAIDAATGGKSRMTGDQEFWQGIITTVVDKSSPLLNLLGQFMLSRAMQASQRPPAPGAPQPGMTPGLPQPTQQPNQPVSPMPPASPTDVSTPQPEQINQLVMMIGETVATALVEGRAGDAYAESFEGLFGTAAYDQLSALGKERMLQIFQSLPMWEKIGILQSKVPGFIDEFLEYGADEPEVASHKMPPAGKDADE